MDVVEKYASLTYLEMFRPVTTLYSNPSSLFELSLDPSFSNQPPKKERHGKHPKFRSYGGTDDESEDGDTGDTDATGGRHRRRPSSSGSWHRQLSPCSVLSVASSGRLYAEPAQTLIFLDWDETWWHCDGAIKS